MRVPEAVATALCALVLRNRDKRRGTMRRASACWLAWASLALVACASVHPSFERRFTEGVRSSHDLWMRILISRYGCDTALVAAERQYRPVNAGAGACDLATLVTPEVVQAWPTSQGIREEWKFRVRTGEPLLSVFLEGPNERALRVVPPVPRMRA